MANNLGIPEVTLAQIVNKDNAINTIGTGGRMSAFEPLVVRIMGHDADTALEEDDPDKMAIFTSKSQGHPWKKDKNVQETVTHQSADGITAAPSNVTCIYPNFDYTTYE